MFGILLSLEVSYLALTCEVSYLEFTLS